MAPRRRRRSGSGDGRAAGSNSRSRGSIRELPEPVRGFPRPRLRHQSVRTFRLREPGGARPIWMHAAMTSRDSPPASRARTRTIECDFRPQSNGTEASPITERLCDERYGLKHARELYSRPGRKYGSSSFQSSKDPRPSGRGFLKSTAAALAVSSSLREIECIV